MKKKSKEIFRKLWIISERNNNNNYNKYSNNKLNKRNKM